MPFHIFLLCCMLTNFCMFQIDAIVRDFGLVVISRSGSNPEKFIYESDQLSSLKVSTCVRCKQYDVGYIHCLSIG